MSDFSIKPIFKPIQPDVRQSGLYQQRTMSGFLSRLGLFLASSVASTCQLCDLNLPQPAQSLCPACWQSLPWFRDALPVMLDQDRQPIQVVCHYNWPVDRLIHLYKYQQRLDLLPLLSTIFLSIAKPDVQALVAVPSAPERLRQRGFNPVLLLARQLSDYWQIPLWQPLARHHTLPQQGLSGQERRSNVQQAFYIALPRPRVIPRKVLIIDDVMTTGSTLQQMQMLLSQLGVHEVHSLVLAHARH